MNFLQICQKTGLRSGLISSQNQMTTTVGQVGRQLKIVDAVQQAHSDLQASRKDWEWLRADFSQALTPGQASYTPAELGIATRFGQFDNDIPIDGYRPMRCYTTATGEADSQDLFQISPECWDMIYGRGAQTNQRPTEYALARGKIFLGSPPDAAYTLLGRYWKAPLELAANGDTPEFPAQYHHILIWDAIRLMSGMDGAFTDRAVALAERKAIFRELVNDQTRRVVLI